MDGYYMNSKIIPFCLVSNTSYSINFLSIQRAFAAFPRVQVDKNLTHLLFFQRNHFNFNKQTTKIFTFVESSSSI